MHAIQAVLEAAVPAFELLKVPSGHCIVPT